MLESGLDCLACAMFVRKLLNTDVVAHKELEVLGTP